MKYNCSDGINRDNDIDRYFLLSEEIQRYQHDIKRLDEEVELLRKELENISFNRLGLVGHAAIRDYLLEKNA